MGKGGIWGVAGMEERGPSTIFIEQKPAWEVLEHSDVCSQQFPVILISLQVEK